MGDMVAPMIKSLMILQQMCSSHSTDSIFADNNGNYNGGLAGFVVKLLTRTT